MDDEEGDEVNGLRRSREVWMRDGLVVAAGVGKAKKLMKMRFERREEKTENKNKFMIIV